MADVQDNNTLYGEKVPKTKAEPEPDDCTRRAQERDRAIARAQYAGYGQPTTPDSPGEEGL